MTTKERPTVESSHGPENTKVDAIVVGSGLGGRRDPRRCKVTPPGVAGVGLGVLIAA
ncbi:hypothetical protein ACFWNH_30415 [Rhodococcus qingshengii]|uniref:hypothetical protein n=1 Tax=Rhodococcus qingshengii TaxID=334542 RepID=UPI0036591575